MATISTDKNGNRKIQFVFASKRRTLYIGKLNLKLAESFKDRVEDLIQASITGQPIDSRTASWVAGLDAQLYAKLVKVGLLKPRADDAPSVTLGAFVKSYIDGRTDVKPRTKNNFEQAKEFLEEYFGVDRNIAAITPGDVDDFRRWLLTKLSDNTVRRHCGRSKQFFRAAVRKKLIETNPFGDMKGCHVRPNRERDFFVSVATAEKVLEHCPDAEWKLIFALSRFGGLRCPSEHLELRWSDISWETGRMTVRSPKTEHHEGKESRVIPIFRQLRPYLDAVYFDERRSSSEFVIAKYRNQDVNLRTQLLRILARAGIAPWPKLFQNLRASRATELAAEFPSHVAASWAGHSIAVAKDHYWQVTDADFAKATQNPTQTNADTEGLQGASEPVELKNPANFQVCPILSTEKVPPRGFEPLLPD